MDYLYYLFMALAFLAVVLLLEGIYLTWNTYKGPEAVRIEKRLQSISAGWHNGTDESAKFIKQRLLSDSPAMERILLHIPRIHQLDRLLIQSGMQLSVMNFIGYSTMALLGGMAIAVLLTLSFFGILLCGVIAVSIPFFIILNARKKRIMRMEQQLPEALDLLARALKAGHAFSGGLKMVADERLEPIASEFREVFEEINYGISVQEALTNLSVRVPLTDLRFFVIAVIIQRESGGNLAELLESTSNLIRGRLKLLGAVRVLSAEGRLSAWILSSLPFAMTLLIHLISPDFMSILFTDPAGHILIGAALVMMVIGIFAMSQIIKIRV